MNGHYYRPQRSCCQGNIFAPVCHSVHRGVLPWCMLGYHTSSGPGTPPRTRHPPGTRHPPREADSGKRSMSGRYASYWNAFLLFIVVHTSANALVFNCCGRGLPVSDVSAMLVATRHFLTSPGAFWKILACRSLGNCEYMGRMASAGGSSSSPNRSENNSSKTVSQSVFLEVFSQMSVLFCLRFSLNELQLHCLQHYGFSAACQRSC